MRRWTTSSCFLPSTEAGDLYLAGRGLWGAKPKALPARGPLTHRQSPGLACGVSLESLLARQQILPFNCMQLFRSVLR